MHFYEKISNNCFLKNKSFFIFKDSLKTREKTFVTAIQIRMVTFLFLFLKSSSLRCRKDYRIGFGQRGFPILLSNIPTPFLYIYIVQASLVVILILKSKLFPKYEFC